MDQRKDVQASLDKDHQHDVYGRRQPSPDRTQGVVAYLEVDGKMLRGDQFLDAVRKIVREEVEANFQRRSRRGGASE